MCKRFQTRLIWALASVLISFPEPTPPIYLEFNETAITFNLLRFESRKQRESVTDTLQEQFSFFGFGFGKCAGKAQPMCRQTKSFA
ncbi:hypothetical protein BY458DRAFT_515735 [Sporodiniella umbellata]|nr:hypothetical protein BY458DRAFT_515728 [Sporodiniella umbellata]KAI9261728.1 hypothetical protein BY458DRAFT_515735 [Sporodiniella umbellata]